MGFARALQTYRLHPLKRKIYARHVWMAIQQVRSLVNALMCCIAASLHADIDVRASVGPIAVPSVCGSVQSLSGLLPCCQLESGGAENPKIWTKCGHHYHLACIYEWLERKQTCPLCETTMSFEELG